MLDFSGAGYFCVKALENDCLLITEITLHYSFVVFSTRGY